MTDGSDSPETKVKPRSISGLNRQQSLSEKLTNGAEEASSPRFVSKNFKMPEFPPTVAPAPSSLKKILKFDGDLPNNDNNNSNSNSNNINHNNNISNFKNNFSDDLADLPERKTGKGLFFHTDSLNFHRDNVLPQAAKTKKATLVDVPSEPKMKQTGTKKGVAEVFTAASELRQLGPLEHCSDAFISYLVAGAEAVQLKPGELRELGICLKAPGDQSVPAAVVVLSGRCRVEIAGVAVENDCGPGHYMGLAAVIAAGVSGFSSNSKSTLMPGSAGAAAEPSIRAHGDKSDKTDQRVFNAILLRSHLFRRGFAEHHGDQARMRPLLQMLSRNVDSSKKMLSALQCSDEAQVVVSRSTTRHIYVAGDVVFTRQGKRSPDGLILVLSGTIALDIDGCEIRRITEGQVIGEDMLLNVCQRWRTTARCVTACDVAVLHRRPLTALAKEMQRSGTLEEQREAQRLLFLLEGRWKEDRVILSLPLFRGLDPDFMAALAKLMETRVIFPGCQVWEGRTGPIEGQERCLHVLLHGAADELTAPGNVKKNASGSDAQGRGDAQPGGSLTLDVKKIRRSLAPGAFLGSREILGLQEQTASVVLARTICLVAVLYRSVFLHTSDQHNQQDLEAPDVTKLLLQELDAVEPLEDEAAKAWPTKADLKSLIPVFLGCDERLMDAILKRAVRRYCMEGQHLCRAGVPSSTLYVVLRGGVCISMAGLTIRHFGRGQAINILALASGSFVPRYDATCTCATEVWAVSQAQLESALSLFPSERRYVSALTSTPVQAFVGVALTVGRTRSKRERQASLARSLTGSELASTQSDKDSGSLGSQRHSNLDPPMEDLRSFHLQDVEFFEACSKEFLQWLQANLETTVRFPDEVIFREGDPIDHLYCVVSGMVNSDSIKAGQESFQRGSVFCEAHLLGVCEQARATAQAAEVTVLQVLHRNIFQLALEKFPHEAAHFDVWAVNWLHKVDGNDLSQVPFLEGCSAGFVLEVSRFAHTRLVPPGGLIVEKGALSGPLCILRSGVAETEGLPQSPRRHPVLKRASTIDLTSMPRTMSAIQSAQLPKLSTINAELVLGVASRASFTVRAEGVCAVTEIEARSFLATLQRFPQEVTRLLRKVSGSGFGQHNKGGALWPTKVEMVPFLSNLGPSFFNRLMEVSEWTMFGPGHRVVRQGGAGNILFLLCHGSAVSKIDGVVVGNPLGPGDVVGDANFLGVTTKYAATVKTTTVCHFRTLTTTLLNKLLPEQPTERKSFEHLRHEVRKQIVIQAQANKQEVLQEKLRRRVDLAFHQHVQQTRSARTERLAHGKAAAARGKSRESETTSQAEDDASQRKRVSSLKAGGGDLAAQLQALAGGKNIDDETDSFGSGSASETEVDNLAALTTSPRKDGVAFRRRVSIDAPTVYTNWRRRSSAFSGVPAGVTPTNHTNNNNNYNNNNNNNDDSSSFSSSNNNNRNSNDELEETAPPKLKIGPVTAAHAKVAIQRRRKWLLNKNSNNNSKRGEEQGDVSRQPFVERVKEAINDYRDRRQEASMKGRVMRLMRNGYPLGPLDAGEPGQPSGVDEDEEARDDFFPDDAPELKSQADTTGTNMSQSQVSSMFDLSELSPEEILHLIQAPGKVRLPDQLSYKEVQRLQKVLPSLPDDKVVSHKSVLPRLSDDPSPELPSLELRQALRSKFRSLTHFRRVPVQQSF